jgi:ABC-type Fe3+ transport system permease subunit
LLYQAPLKGAPYKQKEAPSAPSPQPDEREALPLFCILTSVFCILLPVQKLTATVITLNEERNLEAALQSLAWADEIVVVDSGSTDGTLDIARRHVPRV